MTTKSPREPRRSARSARCRAGQTLRCSGLPQKRLQKRVTEAGCPRTEPGGTRCPNRCGLQGPPPCLGRAGWALDQPRRLPPSPREQKCAEGPHPPGAGTSLEPDGLPGAGGARGGRKTSGDELAGRLWSVRPSDREYLLQVDYRPKRKTQTTELLGEGTEELLCDLGPGENTAHGRKRATLAFDTGGLLPGRRWKRPAPWEKACAHIAGLARYWVQNVSATSKP